LIFKDDGLGAAPQYPDDLFLHKGCGEDYDLRPGYSLNVPDQFNPVSTGQAHIEDHPRWSMQLNCRHCPLGASARRNYHKIGVSFNELAQTRQQYQVIVDENYPCGSERFISRPSSNLRATLASRPRDAALSR